MSKKSEAKTMSPFLIPLLIIVIYVIVSINILAEYERCVIFRLGKLLPQPKGPGVVLVFASIDNLWKGAASQAVQNLNLMFDRPETEGLL